MRVTQSEVLSFHIKWKTNGGNPCKLKPFVFSLITQLKCTFERSNIPRKKNYIMYFWSFNTKYKDLLNLGPWNFQTSSYVPISSITDPFMLLSNLCWSFLKFIGINFYFSIQSTINVAPLGSYSILSEPYIVERDLKKQLEEKILILYHYYAPSCIYYHYTMASISPPHCVEANQRL